MLVEHQETLKSFVAKQLLKRTHFLNFIAPHDLEISFIFKTEGKPDKTLDIHADEEVEDILRLLQNYSTVQPNKVTSTYLAKYSMGYDSLMLLDNKSQTPTAMLVAYKLKGKPMNHKYLHVEEQHLTTLEVGLYLPVDSKYFKEQIMPKDMVFESHPTIYYNINTHNFHLL